VTEWEGIIPAMLSRVSMWKNASLVLAFSIALLLIVGFGVRPPTTPSTT
jgi:hypothetical protein